MENRLWDLSQLGRVVGLARSERAVSSQRLRNGMTFLAYPGDDGVIIGVGYDGDRAYDVRAETVLRKRADFSARFGPWLPSVFADGSWYLLRRVAHSALPSQQALGLSLDDLIAAQELLS